MELHNIYSTVEWRKFERNYLSGMMPHQKMCLDEMLDNDRLTVCMPTGTGKSRVIYGDMMDHLKAPTLDIFAIASHRLLLNVQHFNELVSTLEILASKVGFIMVGSQGIDYGELQKNISMNQRLARESLTYPELFSSCLNTAELHERIAEHRVNGRDVILITTYHSLDKLAGLELHTLYCDEAHLLATASDRAQFKDNFVKVNARRKFFFSATPKDLYVNHDVIDEEDISTDIFLMNNENIFGKRVGLSFRESVEECLIVKPYIHMVEMRKFRDTKDYLSPENYAAVIGLSFDQHRRTLKDTVLCAPKLLVKCPSVPEMWKIREELLRLEGRKFRVLAGASYKENDSSYYSEERAVPGKTEFLRELQGLRPDEEVVILHYDTLSEGIDVPGITGVMFLSKGMPSRPKILQTIGRSTRLLKDDRKALSEGRIAKRDYERMVKPNCAVILPVLSAEMRWSAEQIARMVMSLRDEFGFRPEVYVEPGEDTSGGGGKEGQEGLNMPDEKGRRKSLISDIIHHIEIQDTARLDELQREEIRRMHEGRKVDEAKWVKDFAEILMK